MPEAKLTPTQRREIVLSALDGESKAGLAEDYGVARSWVYSLLEEALNDPQAKLEEAEAEVEFRQAVVERGAEPSVTRRKKEE